MCDVDEDPNDEQVRMVDAVADAIQALLKEKSEGLQRVLAQIGDAWVRDEKIPFIYRDTARKLQAEIDAYTATLRIVNGYRSGQFVLPSD